MSSRLIPLLLALGPVLLVSGPALARPVVVELFTSQGCSSCPPAEALLGELAGRDDLLALGFHVTYWDDLGWKDTASFEGATERQATYAGLLGEGNFTPQLVIDGRRSVVGSRRTEATSAVAAARAEMGAETEIAIVRRNGRFAVTVGAGKGSAKVFLVGFDRSLRTPVARGENSGRTLVQANVVRSLRTLGTWSGEPLEFSEALPAGQDAAVIVQQSDGRILGAARLVPGA
ncbi:thioredoxin family protein [Methylobacterium bullatum]|uniref:DUF1223 domain-containing protein n=1 Tax=Methylobacterium bullatum TaxID=570505 RepID=A0AAV4ZBF6_9HYPH|nr:DUF1223 domain-containing protein [Methylobacterium bullatum]MBD8901350.1 DUF1223 domain-containing protein [Methylobacterium bullatum]GJD40959.1 hypothetical protein OICFNHDK_3436 [Methylobacterium bullatum]